MSNSGKKKSNFKFKKALNVKSIKIANDISSLTFDNGLNLKYLICGELEDQLSAYIDNELDNQMQKTIDQHVSNCKICSVKLSQIKTFSQIINSSQNSLIIPQIKKIDFDLLNECKGMDTLISSYIDGEVTNENKIKIEKHLAKCKACYRDYTQLNELTKELKSYFIKTSNHKFDMYKKNKDCIAFRKEYKNRITKIAIFLLVGILFFSLINTNANSVLLKKKIKQASQKIYSINFVKN